MGPPLPCFWPTSGRARTGRFDLFRQRKAKPVTTMEDGAEDVNDRGPYLLRPDSGALCQVPAGRAQQELR